ncbi:MAG: sigma-70 family RNA polymerase sigma factor [Paraclostridium sp.]
MDIVKLVKKSKKGNSLAFSTLIKHYEKDLYRVAIAITKNNEDALDCIQESILKAYTNIQNLKQDEYFKTWLIKILINQCKYVVEKNKKCVSLLNENVQGSYKDDSSEIEVKSIVNDLEEDLRVLVILYYFEDIGIKDISNMLDIPEGTIKSRLSRARSKLKNMLANN